MHAATTKVSFMGKKRKQPTPPPKQPPLQKRGSHLAPWQAAIFGLAASGLGGCYPSYSPPPPDAPPPNPPQPVDYDAGHNPTTFDSGNLETPPQPEPEMDAGRGDDNTDPPPQPPPQPEPEMDAGGVNENTDPPPQPPPQPEPELDAGSDDDNTELPPQPELDAGRDDEIIPPQPPPQPEPELDAGNDDDHTPPQPPPQPPPDR